MNYKDMSYKTIIKGFVLRGLFGAPCALALGLALRWATQLEDISTNNWEVYAILGLAIGAMMLYHELMKAIESSLR